MNLDRAIQLFLILEVEKGDKQIIKDHEADMNNGHFLFTPLVTYR
jgi:hypothetical protein